jgi:hypothetical protein
VRTGSGLHNLADRAVAGGGTISQPADGGTRILRTTPCPDPRG